MRQQMSVGMAAAGLVFVILPTWAQEPGVPIGRPDALQTGVAGTPGKAKDGAPASRGANAAVRDGIVPESKVGPNVDARDAAAKQDGAQKSRRVDEKGEKAPIVQVIQPPIRNIVRVVALPSLVESYEHTAIHAKLTGFLEKWNVDIGDRVRKGDVLASLFVPELIQDFETKKATVELGKQRVGLAIEMVKAAEAAVQAAEALLNDSRLNLSGCQAEVDRHELEVTRLKNQVEQGVVEPKALVEARTELKSNTAALATAKAAMQNAEAELHRKRAALAKAQLDSKVARADLAVAVSEAKRLEAWVGYLALHAPFDGVIVARNANTFDLVQAAAGAAPIYVVDRTDIIRIFVDVPENIATHVYTGTKASVLVPAYRPQPIPAIIARTSWALNVKRRTLRAEIDLPNPNSQLLPGTYASVKLYIERPGVRAVPVGAVFGSGGKTFCWMYEHRQCVRTEIEPGVSDGAWIEVVNRRLSMSEGVAADDDRPWTPIDGSEQVIVGDRSMLVDGARVTVAPATSEAGIAGLTRSDRSTNMNSAPNPGHAQHPAGDAEDVGNRAADDTLDHFRLDLARQGVKVAEAGVQAAEARCKETGLMVSQRQAEVERWDAEFKRIKREVDHAQVDPGILNESANMLKASTAALNVARAAVATAAAELQFMKARLVKAKVEVKLAQAVLAAGSSDKDHRAPSDTRHDDRREPRHTSH